MILKLRYKSIKAIKTPLKFVIGGFLLSFGLLMGNLAFANFPDYWNENFDNLNVGDLNGQENWSGHSSYDVSTNSNYVFSGTKGIGVPTWEGYDEYIRIITRNIPEEYRINSADVDGWYYLNIPIRVGDKDTETRWLEARYFGSNAVYLFNDSTGIHNYDIYFYGSKFNCETGEFFYSGTIPLQTDIIPPNSWVEINYQFNLTNNFVYVSWTYDGVRTNWSSDNNVCFWSSSPRADIIFSKIEMYGRKAVYFGWDYINNISGIPVGYSPIVEPEKPKNCETNVVDYSNVELKGKITIPLENPNTYKTLEIVIENPKTFSESRYVYVDLPDLKAGDIFNYSTATSIPDYFYYRVYYFVIGVNPLGEPISYYSYCAGTYITETTPIPPEIVLPLETYELPVLDVCDGLSGVEKWLCELKNLVAGIFIPSKAKMNELKNNMDLIKTQFPFNYLNATSNFYDNVKNGINDTSPISFKILGKEGNVDLSFWENSAVVGGISQTFSHIIRNFLTIFLLITFTFWTISFVRRIFK